MSIKSPIAEKLTHLGARRDFFIDQISGLLWNRVWHHLLYSVYDKMGSDIIEVYIAMTTKETLEIKNDINETY